MNKSLFLAACFVASAGAAMVGALTFATQPYVGSDTEYNITNQAILTSGLGNTSVGTPPHNWDAHTNPLGDYSGGGSGTAEVAMVSKAAGGAGQQTGPMSRMLKGGAGKNACAAAQATLNNASGIVIGIDAARVYAANSVISTHQTACNGALTDPLCTKDTGGIAFDNASPAAVAGLHVTGWRDILALLYGGLDRTTNVTDCNGASRKTLVKNWNYLFEGTCPNQFGVCAPDGSCTPGSTCSDGVTLCYNGLTRAWRRDDSSGTADVFSSLIGITAATVDQLGNAIAGFSTSGGGVNGFGASPYCNSLNWDVAETKSGLCGDGVTACALGSVCADASQCLGTCAGATAPLKHFVGPGGLPIPGAAAGEAHRIPPYTCSAGTGSDWRCPAGQIVTSAVWGYAQGIAATATAAQPQVYPTSFQDNDPIRIPCMGNGVATTLGEDVCNDDGNLGVVIPIPPLDFIKAIGNPALVEYTQANECKAGYVFANTPNVYKCAPGIINWANGLCPNNDAAIAQGCQVPTAKPTPSTTTTQCMTIQGKLPTCEHGNCGQDGRVYNLHGFDTTGQWLTQTIAEPAGPVTVTFTGAFARVHQREVLQAFCANSAICNPSGAACADASTCTPVKNCVLDDATDEIGCLVQADPNSVGFGGNTGDTWEQRDPIAAHGTTTGETVGMRLNGLGAGTSCLPAYVAAGTTPNPAANYPMWRKLYFNSIAGFNHVTSTAELNLAEWESTAANIAPIMTTYGFFVLPGSPNGADTSMPPLNKPFCEDFNEFKNCAFTGSTKTGDGTTGNSNACKLNGQSSSFGTVPSDPSADPTAATTSTVCGNGIIEPFEDCDFNAPATGAGSNPVGCGTCSGTCRCPNF